jgi:hypothetical protein
MAVAACGERPATKKSDVTAADVIAGSAQSLDHYESAEGKVGVDFPSVWKGHYVVFPHADTTFGSRMIIDFRFKPEVAWKVAPRTLLAIRIFSQAAWTKATARPGPAIGVKIKERGDDVFVLSLAGSNPYKPDTPAANLFDQMMLSVVNAGAPLRLTPR